MGDVLGSNCCTRRPGVSAGERSRDGGEQQAFFEMMKSDWLRQLIAKVPGYDARETGLLTVTQPSLQKRKCRPSGVKAP